MSQLYRLYSELFHEAGLLCDRPFDLFWNPDGGVTWSYLSYHSEMANVIDPEICHLSLGVLYVNYQSTVSNMRDKEVVHLPRR